MVTTAKKQQIVVVDDDLDIQDLVCAYFKPKGFQVICFNDSESALKESRLSGQNWDVLLTDLRFPKVLGVEFTVQMKKILPNLPIIFITTPKTTEAGVAAVQKGAYDLLVKPILVSQLQISIDRALNLKALKGDLSELKERVRTASTTRTHGIIGRSPKFLLALDVAKRVAASVAHIFISGESGTGKEIFAKFIHNESKRHKGPFIAINCSAIPENLLESELFGHARGAFTGAHTKKVGLFEEAQDGTLFLDEIGDLSLSLQAKLLRVLQEKKIRRVGENLYKPINCRIISATHKDLALEVSEKRFREDLFFRLNVIPIVIPPLRERQEDLVPLAEAFLKRFSLENESSAKSFSKEAIKFVLENPWRGNVRELENVVERAVVLCSTAEISLENLMPLSQGLQSAYGVMPRVAGGNIFSVHYSEQLPTLDEVIYRYLEFAIRQNDGARDKTAKDIGIDRKTLYKRMRPEPSPVQ